MRAALLGLVLASACIPTHRGLSMDRDRIFAAPGSAQVFSAASRVEHREGKALAPSKSDVTFEDNDSDTATRTVIYKVDATTGQETRLGQLGATSWTPLYFDEAAGVLWVRDSANQVVAVGPMTGPMRGWTGLVVGGLMPPLMMSTSDYQRVLWNLASRRSTPLLMNAEQGDLSTAGDVVRFTSITAEPDGSLRVWQTARDASGGMFRELPDLQWQTSPLPPELGTRLAYTTLRDGKRFAEVVRDATGTRLLVYELTNPAPISTIVLGPPAEGTAELLALEGDALVLGVRDADRCLQGVAIRIDSAHVEPLPAKSCVTGTTFTGDRRVLETKNATALVDASARLVELPGVTSTRLKDAIVTGPGRRALVADQVGGELVELDIDAATVTRHPMKGLSYKDVLLGFADGVARFASGPDRIVSIPLAGAGEPTRVTLARPEMTRADRTPLDRTEFWLGGAAGVTTDSVAGGRMTAEIAHWLDDRWQMVFRGNLHFDAATSGGDKKGWFDAGASFGYAWHRLPRLWSLALEADLGANYAAQTLDGKTNGGGHFAPSAEVSIGGQGQIAGLGLGVLVPSLIDFDRGVEFLVTFKIGFTENLK